MALVWTPCVVAGSIDPMRDPLSRVRASPTGLLLLHGQVMPVDLHPISQRHPQIGLLLRWQRLPSLLDIGQCWVGDGVCLSCLLAHGRDCPPSEKLA